MRRVFSKKSNGGVPHKGRKWEESSERGTYNRMSHSKHKEKVRGVLSKSTNEVVIQ